MTGTRERGTVNEKQKGACGSGGMPPPTATELWSGQQAVDSDSSTRHLKRVELRGVDEIGSLHEGHPILPVDALPLGSGVLRGARRRDDLRRDDVQRHDHLRLLLEAHLRGGVQRRLGQPEAAVQEAADAGSGREHPGDAIEGHHRPAGPRGTPSEDHVGARGESVGVRQVRDGCGDDALAAERHVESSGARGDIAHPGVGGAILDIHLEFSGAFHRQGPRRAVESGGSQAEGWFVASHTLFQAAKGLLLSVLMTPPTCVNFFHPTLLAWNEVA